MQQFTGRNNFYFFQLQIHYANNGTMKYFLKFKKMEKGIKNKKKF